MNAPGRPTEAQPVDRFDEWSAELQDADELLNMIVTRFHWAGSMTGTEGELYTFSAKPATCLDGVGSWATGSLHSDIAPGQLLGRCAGQGL